MARFGRSYPLRRYAARPVWKNASTRNVSADVASATGTAYDATAYYGPDTIIVNPTTISVTGQAYDAKVSVAPRPAGALVTGRSGKTYPGIEHPIVTTGTKFILRDIARLPFNNDIQGYGVRFRVISHDRNRVSSWSPFYTVQVPSELEPTNKDISLINVSHFTNVDPHGQDKQSVVSVIWDNILGVDTVDVYEQDDLNPSAKNWTYKGRQHSHQASNIIQFLKHWSDGNVRYSFHRPQLSPQDGHNDDIYRSRLFMTQWIPQDGRVGFGAGNAHDATIST